MASVVRWVVMSTLLHLGIAYGGYRALKSPNEQHTLRVLCLLGVLGCLSYLPMLSLVTSYIPLFLEIRAFVAWIILTMERDTLSVVYEKIWAPLSVLLEDLAVRGLVLRQRIEFHSARLSIQVARHLVCKRSDKSEKQRIAALKELEKLNEFFEAGHTKAQ